MLFGKVTDNQ